MKTTLAGLLIGLTLASLLIINIQAENGALSLGAAETSSLVTERWGGNSTLWLVITVGYDSEMMPREQIASVPYAMIASTAQPQLASLV